MKPDPLGIPRHPLVIYLLCLTAFTGSLTLVGLTASGAINDRLPAEARVSWAIMLAAGSWAALAGMFWQGDARTGLVLKRFGYLGLGLAAPLYAVLVLVTSRAEGLWVGMSALGFGVSCLVAGRRVDLAISAVITETERRES